MATTATITTSYNESRANVAFSDGEQGFPPKWSQRRGGPTAAGELNVGVFETQGIAFTYQYDGFAGKTTLSQLDALAKTGANTVSIVPRLFQTDVSSSALTANVRSADASVLGNLIDHAHADGLAVTLTPHLDITDGGLRSVLAPTDVAGWFKNYTAQLVDYAKIAQSHGAEMLSIGTEMNSMAVAANAGYWDDLIAAVRHVYSGKLTYQSDWYDAGDVPFWSKVDVISVDAYVPVATNGTPTVESVVKAWDTVPTDTWQAANFNYMSPLDFYRSLAVTNGKPLQFGEFGYANHDGAGMHPSSTGGSQTLDPGEQKVLMEGFFQVFGKETSWFQGANMWEWLDTPSATPQVDLTLQNSGSLSVIKDWYSGANNARLNSTLNGTDANDRLAGGSGADRLVGGKGSDTLIGAGGDDVLIGDGDTNPLRDKLVVKATGSPAAGVDALMKVMVNGVVVGTVSVPKNADGSSSTFTFSLTPGLAVTSVSVAFVNDIRTATEDRNLVVQQVSLNGNNLSVADSTNLHYPGTFSLYSNGSLDFNLSKHPDYSGATINGNDTLTGGDGTDTFVFARNGGHDTITDFGHNGDHDVIDISDLLGAGLQPTLTAIGADTQISFATGETVLVRGVQPGNLQATATGFTYTDASAQSSLFAVAHLAPAAEVIDGTSGDDNLVGGDGDSTIYGHEGNDTLYGGAGANTLAGGTGNDTYIIDHAGETVIENAGEGVDLVRSSISYTLGDNVENLTLTGTDAINGTGNALDNLLTGNAGNNVLDGGAGNDILDGGGGNDTLIGGAGDDVFVVDSAGDVVQEAVGGGNDKVLAQTSYTLGAGQEIEALMAYDVSSTTPLTLTGNELDNYIVGGAGNDTLVGGAGNDILVGGAGNDVLDGGTGNDVFIVDSAGDVVREAVGGGNDTVYASVSYTLGAGQEIETLVTTDMAATAAINLTGNEFNNYIAGNAGDNILDGGAGNDILDGGAGNDTLIGGAGNDVLVGGAGSDTMIGGAGDDAYVVDSASDVVREAAGGGKDIVYAAVNYTLGAGQEIETLVTSNGEGTAPINLTGNELDNYIAGNAGDNILDGGAGNDILDGGAGNDTLIGGAGNDVFVVDSANDIVREAAGGGKDTVYAAVSYTLGAGQEIETLVTANGAGTAAINLTGNEFDNYLAGNAGDNILDGGAGNDILDGGAGNDTMIGGTGNDVFIVDSANDVVREAAGGGNDTVYAAVSYTLGAGQEIETLVTTNGTGTAAINLTGNEFDNYLAGNAGNNILDGGAGNDVLDGGAGNDTMIGGAGNDVFIVDSANDVVREAAGGGNDMVYASVSYTLGAGQEIESLVTANAVATTAINLTGNEFNNYIAGNAGDNILDGGAGNDILDGGAGNDTMIGGTGNDVFIVDSAGDVVKEAAGGGTDTVYASVSYALGAGQEVENLVTTNGTGTATINLTGNEFANYLAGNAGNNILDGGAGNDVLDGGAGNDVLIGGAGKDTLIGGDGADRFVFRDGDTGATDATADIVVNFSHAQGDKLDLSQIDANSLAGGDQAFTLHSSGADHVAGAAWLTQTDDATIVNLDTDGDGKADYMIHVTTEGHTPLNSSDFIF